MIEIPMQAFLFFGKIFGLIGLILSILVYFIAAPPFTIILLPVALILSLIGYLSKNKRSSLLTLYFSVLTVPALFYINKHDNYIFHSIILAIGVVLSIILFFDFEKSKKQH